MLKKIFVILSFFIIVSILGAKLSQWVVAWEIKYRRNENFASSANFSVNENLSLAFLVSLLSGSVGLGLIVFGQKQPSDEKE